MTDREGEWSQIQPVFERICLQSKVPRVAKAIQRTPRHVYRMLNGQTVPQSRTLDRVRKLIREVERDGIARD